MRIFGIRSAVGLFLTIAILKLLMSAPFEAFEKFLVTFFTTADTTLQNVPQTASALQIPTVPGVR